MGMIRRDQEDCGAVQHVAERRFLWAAPGVTQRLRVVHPHDATDLGAVLFLVVLVCCIVWTRAAIASPRLTGFATYYTVASCQREGTSGIHTATGEVYDESAFTCALRHRDFGGLYRVCAASHPARCVVCRHNDFGPGRRAAAHGVVVDLSPVAFDALGGRRGVTARGVAWGELVVTVEAL